MITYNGGSLNNLVKYLGSKNALYVTDTAARATRYANAQATGEVNADLDQELAPGAVIIEITTEVNFLRRDNDHSSLDTCEAVAKQYQIIKATVCPPTYSNTLYGNRHTGYKSFEQVVELLKDNGIEVEVTPR